MKKIYLLILTLTFGFYFALAQKPVANFSASKDSLCSNDCITLSDSSLNNPTSWQWTFTGGLPLTSSDQNPPVVCYLDSGSYDVKLVVSNSSGSDSITKKNYIAVFAPPPTPVIRQSGDTLFFPMDSVHTYYKWNFDSLHINIDSVNKRFYFIIDTCGNFNLMVTDTCTGCSIGVSINIVCAGINNLIDENVIIVYPTPAANQLTVHSSHHYDGNITISIMNVVGDLVKEEKLKWNNNIFLNITNLHAGIYFLQLKSESGSVMKRFIKE